METAEADIETAEELSKVSHSNTNLHGTNEGPIRSANRAGHREKESVVRFPFRGATDVAFRLPIFEALKPLAVADVD
jgi:hypothetical protein